MAHPKRQHSKQRQRKRRTHWKISIGSFSPCGNCQKPILAHRVCPFCGHYKKKLVIDTTPKETEKK